MGVVQWVNDGYAILYERHAFSADELRCWTTQWSPTTGTKGVPFNPFLIANSHLTAPE